MNVPSDDGDDVAKSDDQKTFHKPGLTNDPSESKEKHDTPNVQQTSHENALKPEKKNNHFNSGINLLLLSYS